MKRRFAWLLAVLLMLALLCACAETKTASTEPYTVGSYTVTPINEKSGTITDGTNTYSYRYSRSGSGYSVTFSYPDRTTYTWTENGSSGTGSASMEFDFAKYPSGMELNGVLSRTHPNVQKEKPVAVILVLLFVGAFNAAWPTGAWYLEVGWKFRDAEPSDAALGWNRASGVLALIVAVILIIA